MSLSVEANTWAPKLIIAIQLTVWSLVGMMLLHKGAASLSRKPEARNDTGQLQGRFRGVWNEKESNITESQPQIANRRKDVVNVDDLDNVLLYREQLQRSNGIVRESVIRKRTTIVREEGTDGARGQIVRASSSEKQAAIGHGEDRIKNANRMKSTVNENVFTLLEYDERRSHSVDLVASDEDNSFERENKSSIGSDAKEMEKHKDDTVSQRSSVNRIGAAAAILMLAIGVIMLLLGPLIVIVRAISKRRRTREMLVKPMRRNDQPPTYEEATLMDRVPRYSTLQLDTILEPSSP